MHLPEGTILKSRYKIIKKIGGGGYAMVYLTEDILKEGLWAVKEMLTDEQSNIRDIIDQFWFEAKIMVKLSHLQLPRIEDFFEENGKYYIVMEYIDGKDLFDIVNSAPSVFSVSCVTEWILNVCDVLEYLHSQTPHPVIFRDLKPENIMLSKTGEIKLIDFGICKLFDVTENTRNNAKAVSPYFSSPEQYGGKRTDERSDIYSLGATMYYLYTANFPIDAIDRLINEAPLDPPSKFNSHLPAGLDKLIFKAMELNKTDRYQEVKEIRIELEGLFPECNKEDIPKPELIKGYPGERFRICPGCGRKNPEYSRFCGKCGLPLQDVDLIILDKDEHSPDLSTTELKSIGQVSEIKPLAAIKPFPVEPLLPKIDEISPAEIELADELIKETEKFSIELDIPEMAGTDEEFCGKVYFEVPSETKLSITTPTDFFEGTISGTGFTEFEVLAPGEITGEISLGDKRVSLKKTIVPSGIEESISSQIHYLKKGEFIEGESMILYPSSGYLLNGIISSFQKFPFNSSEILSAKLGTLGIKYKLFLSRGDFPGELNVLEKEINDKLQTLYVFMKDGLFSLWEEGKPSKKVSVKVLGNIRFFKELGFPLAEKIIQDCSATLLSKGVRRYSLRDLNINFTPAVGEEGLIIKYLYGPENLRPQLAGLIRLLAVGREGLLSWEGDEFWGGVPEATCQALKVMYRSGDAEFFEKGLKFIFKRFKEETLQSTSDTLALIELLSEIKLSSGFRGRINDELSSFEEPVFVHGKIEATEDNLIVRVDRKETINYLKRGTEKLSVQVFPLNVLIGEMVSITIKPDIKTLCPIAKVYLPGILDLLDVTPGIQTVCLPIKEDVLEIHALAVRKGRGKIRVVIEDFYKPSLGGFSESNELVSDE